MDDGTRVVEAFQSWKEFVHDRVGSLGEQGNLVDPAMDCASKENWYCLHHRHWHCRCRLLMDSAVKIPQSPIHQ